MTNQLLAELEMANKEIERLNKSLEEQRHFYLKQLGQKENIIKEVREYNEEILKESWYGGNEKDYAKHNLEILDKAGSDKE